MQFIAKQRRSSKLINVEIKQFFKKKKFEQLGCTINQHFIRLEYYNIEKWKFNQN